MIPMMIDRNKGTLALGGVSNRKEPLKSGGDGVTGHPMKKRRNHARSSAAEAVYHGA